MPFLLDINEELTPDRVCEYIKIHHDKLCPRYDILRAYYEGKHKILDRKPKHDDNPCNNVVCNYAKYISDFAAGYLIGEPISYSSEKQDLDDLQEWNQIAQTDVQDMDNAKYQSIYGVAYEIVYENKRGEAKTGSVHPSQAFVIYDNSIELNKIAGVYYYEMHDPQTQRLSGYHCVVVTAAEYWSFEISTEFSKTSEVDVRENRFGLVTLIEIYNNNEKQGDFEQLIPLIDAYNMQQSSRVDDVENFVNALMVLTGQTLGDTSKEKSETMQAIKNTGVIELTPDGKLEFLTRQIDQNGNETLRQSMADDIHKFSCVPSLTDKDFASNVSGVAMQFKLLGLNQITKIKERYMKEGIRERIELFSALMELKGLSPVDTSDLSITFTHSLPKNLVEIAQVIGNLQGICSNETLVAQLPFVEDPENEVKKAAEEKQAAMDREFVMNTPIMRNAE